MTFSSIKYGFFGIAFTAISACSSEPYNHDGDKSTGQEVNTTGELSVDPIADAEANADAETLASGVQGADAGTIRSADAHSHGQANLAIVMEGGSVFIELESPLYNILGFEHVPKDERQEQVVFDARLTLTKPDDLFVFTSGAGCELSKFEEIPEFFEHAGSQHHRDDEHDEDHGEHKDIIVSYEYDCEKPEVISDVTVNLFDSFEAMSELNVTILGPNLQKQVTLSPENSTIKF